MSNISISPRISIVIPVFNKVEFTQRCIETIYSVTETGIPFEIIIVDNGSNDSTPVFLKKAQALYPSLQVITHSQNLGFARACNAGAKEARGNYILFLNNDTEPQPNWLTPLIDVLENNPNVAAVGSKLLFPDRTIQHAGIIIVQDLRLSIEPGITHIYYQQPEDLPDANEIRVYPALTAAALTVRASAFQSAGGFDEEYWNGLEDIDLCFKLRQNGHLLIYQPWSVIIHHESASGPERFSKTDKNVERLMTRWKTFIQPDYTRNKDTAFHLTKESPIRPYSPKTTPHVSPEMKLQTLPLHFINPGYIAYMLIHLGEKYEDKNPSKSNKYYEKALELLTTKRVLNPTDLYRIGSLYKRLNEYEVAVEWFEELLKSDCSPNLKAGAHYHTGEMFAKKKWFKNARTHLETCLQLLPEHKKAKELLTHLQEIPK